MNYINYFAKGGKSSKQLPSGEEWQVIIKNALDTDDDNAVTAALNKALQEKGSREKLTEALQSAYMDASTEDELYEKIRTVLGVSETSTLQSSSVFKCGGKMQRLSQRFARGGAADCGCKKKIPMHQNSGELGGNLRQRGTATSTSTYPDYDDKSAWTRWNGADVANYFNGTTLEQHVVTPGIWGTPRRVVRVIRNYYDPAQADTTYVDARGVTGRKKPTFFDRLFGAIHSPEFMGGLDSTLEGYEPHALNEKETKTIEKKSKNK